MNIGQLQVPLFSTVVRSVDPGHVVEHRGRKLTVEANKPVFRGSEIFMTHDDYESFKSHPRVKNFKEVDWGDRQ